MSSRPGSEVVRAASPPVPARRTGDAAVPRQRRAGAARARDIPRWALAVAGIPVLLLVAGVCVALTVPMVLHHGDEATWEDTAVRLPAAVAGRQRNPQAPVQRLIGRQLAAAGIPVSAAAAYGPLDRGIVVLVARRPARPADERRQAEQRERVVSAFQAEGVSLRLGRRDGGALGGWFGCGTTPPGLTLCAGTDAGSEFYAMIGPQVNDPQQVARAAREATVGRR